jgi:cobalt-zinc-cadmium efflux system outer membrane protein
MRFLFATLALALGGCASTSAAPAFKDTGKLLEDRGYRIVWRSGAEEDAEADKAVKSLLAKELTVDAAVQIALLNDRRLQATYEDLGVAQADLVQAGLLKNPVFTGAYHTPVSGGSGPSINSDLVFDFIDLFVRGARNHVAQTALEAAKYRVAAAVVQHAHEVKKAWFTAVAATQTLAMRKIVAETADAAVDLAERQHEAGNLDDLGLANERATRAQILLDLKRSEAEVTSSRERINRLLGLWGSATAWKLPEKLMELPAAEPNAQHLESLAVARRFDLAAAHKDVEVISYGLALAKNTRWFGGVEAGVSYDQETERVKLVGATVTVEIPLFDQRQAAIARIESQLRKAKAHEYALAVDIRADVRESLAAVTTARDVVVTYGKDVVPLREKVVELSQQYYDAMLLGVYQLLAAKQAEVDAYRSYIESLRDYWIARADLELATGGPITQPATAKTTKEKS